MRYGIGTIGLAIALFTGIRCAAAGDQAVVAFRQAIIGIAPRHETDLNPRGPELDMSKLVDGMDFRDDVMTTLDALKKEQGDQAVKGKVARVADAVIYTTLGGDKNVCVGDHLNIVRNQGQIKDPDTGKVLGEDLAKIAEVEITEVQPSFSKAKLVGGADLKLVAGDIVELPPFQLRVAFFPPVDQNGRESVRGTAVARLVVLRMIQGGVPLVEMNRSEAALTELALPAWDLFDAPNAQKFGKKVQASVVLVGRILPRDLTNFDVDFRLVEVRTGKILLERAARLGTTVNANGARTQPSNTEKENDSEELTFAPPAEKIIVEDKHPGIAANHPSRTHASEYLARISPKDPMVKIGDTMLYFQAQCPAANGNTHGTVQVSIDYGKTWVSAFEWDVTTCRAAARKEDWTAIDLATVFPKQQDKEVDELRVQFNLNGIVEELDITKIDWVMK